MDYLKNCIAVFLSSDRLHGFYDISGNHLPGERNNNVIITSGNAL